MLNGMIEIDIMATAAGDGYSAIDDSRPGLLRPQRDHISFL